MQKKLNITNTQKAIGEGGYTQTAVGEHLGVSREAVSQWLSEKSFPRPSMLLKLGKFLNLSFSELVLIEDTEIPQIAFRKKQGTKTKDHHIEDAQDMGRFLRELVPYLSFDNLKVLPTLRDPSLDYEYLNKVVADIRKRINVGMTDILELSNLLNLFQELNATLIPVLWNKKNAHGNALRIYLPDSKTTWIYLDLDTNIHDFKFWMAHELGHCLAPALLDDNGEAFAEAFAQALLFPKELAQREYININKQASDRNKIKYILSLADRLMISPYTIIKELAVYASAEGKPEINPPKNFAGAVTNFNKKYPNVYEELFEQKTNKTGDIVSAVDYIANVSLKFGSNFFDILKTYIKDHNKSFSYIKTVLAVGSMDARSIHKELS